MNLEKVIYVNGLIGHINIQESETYFSFENSRNKYRLLHNDPSIEILHEVGYYFDSVAKEFCIDQVFEKLSSFWQNRYIQLFPDPSGCLLPDEVLFYRTYIKAMTIYDNHDFRDYTIKINNIKVMFSPSDDDVTLWKYKKETNTFSGAIDHRPVTLGKNIPVEHHNGENL